MLLDSITHAKEDIKLRSLVEAQTEARQLADTTNHFLEKNKLLLKEEEIQTTKAALSDLEELIIKGNKDSIQAGIERLNEISRPYAERLMDEAIASAMKGKNINS